MIAPTLIENVFIFGGKNHVNDEIFLELIL